MDLRSKLGQYPSFVPTVEKQQEAIDFARFLASPRESFLPLQLLCFLFLPFSAQFCANIFFPHL